MIFQACYGSIGSTEIVYKVIALVIGFTGCYFSLALGWRCQLLAIGLLTLWQTAFQEKREGKKNMHARELAKTEVVVFFIT